MKIKPTKKPIRFTIGKLAKRFRIARSTLLYYESMGLIAAVGRTDANYRLFDEAAVERLEQIITYRQAGLPVDDIRRILDGNTGRRTGVLERQLQLLNRQIEILREQQRVLVKLLGSRTYLDKTRTMDKAQWETLLKKSGLTEEDMATWHREFERMSPNAHQDFLESLGISKKDVDAIRAWSRSIKTTR